MNREGYKDPTADRAVREADKVPESAIELIYLLKNVASLAGYEITGRIWLKDRNTGKEYRQLGGGDADGQGGAG